MDSYYDYEARGMIGRQDCKLPDLQQSLDEAPVRRRALHRSEESSRSHAHALSPSAFIQCQVWHQQNYDETLKSSHYVDLQLATNVGINVRPRTTPRSAATSGSTNDKLIWHHPR